MSAWESAPIIDSEKKPSWESAPMVSEQSVPEKPFSFIEAVKAVPAAISTLYGGALEGGLVGYGRGITTVGQGVKQLGMDVFGSKEQSQNYQQDITEERNLYEQSLAKESPAFKGGARVGQVAGTVAPTIPLLPALGTPAAIAKAGALARVGYSAAVGGGLFGATQPVYEGESRAEKMRNAAATAAVLTAALEPVSASARPLASLFTNRSDAEAAKGMLKYNPVFEEGVKTEAITGAKLTPGQISGSPSLSEMRAPQEFLNKQAKDATRFFLSLRDKITKEPKTSAQLATTFDDSANKTIDSLVAIRKKTGDVYYNLFKDSVKKIQGNNLLTKLESIAKDAVPSTPEAAAINMSKHLGRQLEKSGGALTSQQFLVWKQRIDKIAEGKSDLFKDMSIANQKRLGAEMSDALWKDIDETASTLGIAGVADPALKLKKAVDAYKNMSKPIHEIEESALGAIFGKRKMVSGEAKLTPEKMGERLMSLEPSEVASVYSILKKYNPSLIQEYQATKLYEAIRTANKLTPGSSGKMATETKFDPKQALEMLLGPKNESLRPVFATDPELMTGVARGVRLLDRVGDRVATVGKTGASQKAADVARNAVSGSPIFIAGAAAKYLGPAGLWKLTSTDGGRNLLKTIATAPLNSPKFSAAISDLVNEYLDIAEGQEIQERISD